jgi:2-iminobutanoate/2-iminopropanoate deaminase
MLYCSGQTPIHPSTMKIQASSIEEQTKQVIQNPELVLREAGLTFNNIVKTNVFFIRYATILWYECKVC